MHYEVVVVLPTVVLECISHKEHNKVIFPYKMKKIYTIQQFAFFQKTFFIYFKNLFFF